MSRRTLRAAIAKIKAEPQPPAFVLHTGDLTHLSRDGGVRHAAAGDLGTVAPGFLRAGRARRPRGRRGDLSAAIRQGHARRRLAELRPRRHALHRTRQRRQPEGWRARLAGDDQLEWLEKDVKPLKSSTPIVVFAHIPLWTVYPDWGWGTEDSAQALSY